MSRTNAIKDSECTHSHGILSGMSPTLRFIVSLFTAFFSIVFLFGISAIVAGFIYNASPLDYFQISENLSSASGIGMTKIFLITQTIALFGVLPLSFIVIFNKSNTLSYLQLDSNKHSRYIAFIIPIMIIAIPFINFVGEFNGLLIEAFLGKENYFKDLLKQNEVLTLKIIKADTLPALLYNLFIIAVLPGIFEELCFRGAIQTAIVKQLKNPHIAILLTGILFGLFHVEFYGIIPRTMMGIFFGYLLYWTNNLWFPIIAHFTNNATIVIVTYFINKNIIDQSMDKVGANNETMIWGLFSGIIAALLCFFLFRLIQANKS